MFEIEVCDMFICYIYYNFFSCTSIHICDASPILYNLIYQNQEKRLILKENFP